MYQGFIRDAIESADNYYKSAEKKQHSRIEIRVTGIKKIASDLYLLTLSQKLKHADSACLCIESHLIEPSWYEDPNNHYIATSHFKVIQLGEEKATATVEVRNNLLTVFDNLLPEEIKFVSDLKFLIMNVKKWYGSFGHFVHCPPTPSLSDDEIYFSGNESDKQKDAIKTALSKSLSYIWGAPGTGKTQMVLANCILSYIRKGQQVLVLAPTNNAIEQTLRSVIRALEEQGEDINCLYRLGTSSESFAQQYGTICEKIDQQAKIEALRQSLDGLLMQKEREEQAEKILDCYEQLKKTASVYKRYCSRQETLEEKIDQTKTRINQISREAPLFQKTLSDIYSRLDQLSARENSTSFKLKRFFTKKEEDTIQREKNDLSFRLTHAQTHLAKLENEQAAALHALNETQKQFLQAKESKQKAYYQAKEIAQPFLHLGTFTAEFACAHLEKIVAQYADFTPDKSLSEKIAQKEKLLQQLTDTVSQTLEEKLVFAFTVDYFFAHYKSLADVGISSSRVSHIFLDEAAYCPLIKSGILFSLNAPVTLLGDHMQLPPICEASDRATADPTTKLFLWDMSAIYFSEVFDIESSLDTLFERYKSLKSRAKKDVTTLSSLSEENLSIATLPYTFRFGHNLASLLDEFIYHTGFSGRTDFDTEITVIHAKKRASETELRANIGEAEAIKKYLLAHRPTQYVIMSPYKTQRAVLIDTLRGITSPDDILTIHASQGREWDTVIISVTDVASPFLVNSSLPQGLHALNTAISRAKKNIVIVCDCDYWHKHADSQLIGRLVETATYIL